MSQLYTPPTAAIHTMLHRTLRAWLKGPSAPQTLFDELLYFQPPANELTSPRIEQIENAYAKLESTLQQFSSDPRHVEVLTRRFRRGENTRKISFDWHCSPDHVNRVQREALHSLAFWLRSQEEMLRSRDIHRQLARLPASSYSVLVGRERQTARLARLLQQAAGPGVVALTGLGGLGKTALADAVARQVIQACAFKEVVWLRAEPGDNWNWSAIKERLARSLLPDLRAGSDFDAELLRLLKQRPHLVVLDNLEAEAAESWLQELQTFCLPSKFLLTHRNLPGVYKDVHVVKVNELSQNQAEQFLVRQLQLLGLSAAAEDVQASPGRIFEHTGGNPLALKLVAGLLRSLSLESILQALQRGSSASAEQLYSNIYEAAWQALSPAARSLLLTFILVGEEGASPDHLENISGLSERQRHDALQQLTTLGLLELRSATQQPRYGVHRLTQTFLAAHLPKLPAAQRRAQQRSVAANLAYWTARLGSGAAAASEEGNLAQAVLHGLSPRDLWPACAELLILLQPQLRSQGAAARWIKSYQQATQHTAAEPARLASLHNQLGALAWQLEDYPRAMAAFETALDLARQTRLKGQAHTAIIGICLCHWSLGQAGEGQRVARSALQEAADEPRLQALNALACYARGQYAASEKYFRRALSLLPDGDNEMAVQLHIHRGMNLQMQGKLVAALKQYAQAAHRLGEQAQASREAAHLELIRSSAFYLLGDMENADACLRRANQYAPLSEEAASRAYFESSLGRLSLQLGSQQAAERHLKNAARLWQKAGKLRMTVNAIDLLKTARPV